jgi:hypothetical protein
MMPDRALVSVVCVATLLLAACIGGYAADLSRNGSCEEVKDGKPVGWGPYLGGSSWGSLEDGYKGKGIWFEPGPFSPIESGDRKGENYINTGIVQGSSYGTSGADALVHTPSEDARYFKRGGSDAYKVSFWIKSECNKIKVFLQGWTTEQATGADRGGGGGLVSRIGELDEWTYFEATSSVGAGVKKIAVCFQVWGYEQDGLKLGRVCIDELKIERVSGLNADSLRRIEIPDAPAVYVGQTPLEEIIAAYRAGDDGAVSQVGAALRQADELAEHSDEWYRQFYGNFEPRGIYTTSCPIHPFLTRYYNDFEWSLDEPWKLVCPHCKAEGRKYYYYPNPDYPDDGSGCAPTDEVWARDHDAAWSKAHRNIPHDHWDGSSHAYLDSRRYYFKGKYYVNALNRMHHSIGPALALAYHYAHELFPPDSEQYKKAELYAHKAKVIMVCSARAYLGDDYLAAAEGITPAQFQKRMCEFYQPSETDEWQYQKLDGFRLFDNRDVIADDPVWEGVGVRDGRLFPGSWNSRAAAAGHLLELICRLRASFGEDEDDIRRICQRPLVSFPEDREKVAMGQDPPAFYLKRGVFETEMHPFNLDSGGDNLLASTILPRIRAGLFLRDDEIIEKVAQDVTYFWRNYFSQDGLGKEGSPTYSAYGVAGLGDMLFGLKGNFDKTAPYYDADNDTINLNKMPVYAGCAVKMPYYVTDDDDHYISWEDSCYGAQRTTRQHQRILKYGGTIPEKHLKYLNISKQPDGSYSVSFNKSIPWPSVLLHDRRKAVLRAGHVEQPTVVSLDWTKMCGHYHPPTQTLMVHACGQELASDLGYMGSCHFLTTQWIKTYPAHNSLTIRKEDGNPHGTGKLRGDLRKHFITTPTCQIVDTAEYDQADWKAAGEDDVGEFSRQVFLMVPSDQHQYVVDIVRGKGGATHDYYLHCHGLGFDTTGIKLQPVADPDEDLYEYSGWSFSCAADWGSHNIHELTAGKSSGPWQATWSQIDDYRGQPKEKPLIHDDVFMRLWMLDEAGSEVIVGTGPAQRYLRNNDFQRTMKVLCVRRQNTENIDIFAGVIEPYRDEPFITAVRRLETGSDDGYTVALAIETIHGTDYLISYGGPGEPSEVSVTDGEHRISTDADVAVVSYPHSGGVRLLAAAGGYVKADGFQMTLDGPSELSGRLLDFDDTHDTLTIESGDAFPLGDTLAGLPIIVQHTEDRSSFTIASIERLGADKYLVHLDDQPHIVSNWLLVTDVGSSGITFEPPAVLDSKNTYKVYAGEPGKLRLLGPLRHFNTQHIYSEDGRLMHSFSAVATDDYGGVEPGQEIGLSRLEKGVDTVSVTNFAYAMTDM